jgi:integrase/recombinase XerD
MKSNTISISFFIVKSRTNQQGKCSIRCRITINKNRKEFSTGITIKPENWDINNQEATSDKESDFINDSLYLIKQKLRDCHLKLKINDAPFDIDDLLAIYNGKTTQNEKGVLEVYALHNNHIKRLVGKDIKQVTYEKYLESENHLSHFVKFKFKKMDMPLKSMKPSFVDEFEYYLKTEKNLQQSTINKVIQRLRKVVKYAIINDHLQKDPFLSFKPKTVKKEVVFLSKEELDKLEKHTFENPRLEKIKDMFVFCCYTGLGFKEMANLRHIDIQKGFDDELWLEVKRQKTGKSYKVPLFDVVKIIIYKYKTEVEEFVLPNISNSNFNAYLKEIADIVGIKKHLTHHIARKTFASTVLLYNDVSMEIVSELLGHSSLRITQGYYGKIVQKKVSEAFNTLKKKIK